MLMGAESCLQLMQVEAFVHRNVFLHAALPSHTENTSQGHASKLHCFRLVNHHGTCHGPLPHLGMAIEDINVVAGCVYHPYSVATNIVERLAIQVELAAIARYETCGRKKKQNNAH